ncbi:MAG: hypothetical protein JWR74_3199 [Polaromonas sp.]|nr:hypothetical protein [Polaromonas sp.]
MTKNSKTAAISGKTAKPRGKPFVKGASGNAAGRPKLTPEAVDLIAACKEKTASALDVLMQIMENGENERNRMAAALAIIERGHGKAIQPTTVGNPDGSPIDMSIKLSFVKPA